MHQRFDLRLDRGKLYLREKGFYLCDEGECKKNREAKLQKEKTLYDQHKETYGHESWCYVNPGERKVKEENE
jgi:hypothetical protein